MKPVERQAAMNYAKISSKEGVAPVELEEGEGDDTFWMMLDDGEYANASYWKFRHQSQIFSPRLWNASSGALQPVIPFSAHDLTSDRVFLFDGIFELFVLVGENARGKRDEIRLALAAAEAISAASEMTRIFPPPIHVLVFPSRLPIDLETSFRLMDEVDLVKYPLWPCIIHTNLVIAETTLTRAY